MRYAVLTLLLCACSSLSTTEAEQLALYQRNAKHYWEGNRLDQALGQIERGLEIDPDDYTLGTMLGGILLKQSPSSQGTDHRLLDRATTVLARVYGNRSERHHGPSLLFNYGLALQKQARRHAGEATRLEALAARGDESIDTAEIGSKRAQSDAELAKANHLFGVLIGRGELLRLCHYHMLLGARDFGQHDAVAEHSRQYLARTALEQKAAEAEIRRTNEPLYEREQKLQLARLRSEELEVRSLLAEYHYERKEFATALSMLDRVLEIDPSRSTDYYNRGRVYLHLDRDADARADFRKFLATTDLPASSDKAVFAAATLSK